MLCGLHRLSSPDKQNTSQLWESLDSLELFVVFFWNKKKVAKESQYCVSVTQKEVCRPLWQRIVRYMHVMM